MSVGLNLAVLIFTILYYIVYPFLFYIPKKQRKSVPPPTNDLLKISATKLSELIRQRKISSEDVVQAYINRIKEVNNLINAVVEDRFEDALKEAKAVNDYLRTTSLTQDELRKIKPLLGVPVTIKECCMLSGMSFAGGTWSRRGIKADTDGDAVARVKMSGAIPLLVSNTPELCMGFDCFNKITGRTSNPHDLTRTSGASSGGEGALLGAGASLIGIGSDLAGSIRYPAMCCGVFGHKPTPRIIPLRGHFPLPTDKKIADYLVIGPMARYAEDLKLLMMVMGEKQSIELKLTEKVDLSKLRVYFMDQLASSFINPNVKPEIKEAIFKGVEHLNRNCRTQTIHNSDFKNDLKNAFALSASLLCQLEGTPNLLKAENQNGILELFKAIFGSSKLTVSYLLMWNEISSKNLIAEESHSQICEDLKKKFSALLSSNGVLLCPTFPSAALKHSEVFFKVSDSVYTQIFNVLGFPATQVPCGKSSDGLPIGIQVVAAPHQDRLCFAVAEELEKCFGGWIPSHKT